MRDFIPEEIIEEIRRSSNIVDVISEYVLLTRKGQNYFGLCPFHGEKTPSFSVSPDKQIFYCFGCGAGGNVFSFVMQRENLTFPEAVHLLADKIGVKIPDTADDEWNKEKEVKNRFFEINSLAKDFYQYVLNKMKVGQVAREYLKKRGLNQEVVEEFQLGYAPDSWDALKNFLTKKNYQENELNEIGLVLPRNDQRGFYDRFRHRLMFPIWDVKGNIIGFGGRILGNGEPKYLNSPESTLYNKRANLYAIHLAVKSIRELDQVILVEGYLDVITAHQFGIKNTVASLGTALTKEQIKLLMRYTHNVVLAYDADAAGVNATSRGIELLHSQGCKVKILTIPDGKDPDEFIRNKGQQAFKKLIKEALPLVQYKLEQAISKYSLEIPENKAKIVEELAPFLLSINSEVEKEIYLKMVAKALNLQVKTIVAEIRKGQQKKANHWQYRDKDDKNRHNTNIDNKYIAKKKENPLSARNKGEAFLLRLVLEKPDLWTEVKSRLGVDFSQTKEYNQITQVLEELLSNQQGFETAQLFSHLHESSTIGILNNILNLELPTENFRQTFDDCLLLVEREISKGKKEGILKEIAEAEKAGDFKLVRELMQKLKEIQS